MRPIVQVLIGFVNESQGRIEQAILSYCDGHLVDSKRIMTCLVQSFISQTIDLNQPFDQLKFVGRALGVSPVLGLHAYRLVIEIYYRELLVKLGVDHFNMDKFLALGSFRTYPGSHWNAAIKKDANGLLQR